MTLRLVILSILVSILAGCGGNPQPNQTSETISPGAATAIATTTPTGPATTPVPPTLNVLVPTTTRVSPPLTNPPDSAAAPQTVLLWQGDAMPFNGPTGIAVVAQDAVYVVDAKNSRVVKFDASGKPVLTFGSRGSGDGQFSFISENTGYLALDTRGNLYVADPDNARVDKFDSAGKFLQAWQISNESDTLAPAYLTIDAQDHVYLVAVDVAGKPFLYQYTTDGKRAAEFGKSANVTLQGPLAIASDAQGRVYVPDIIGIVYTFDAQGKLLDRFSLPPVKNLFTTPTGIVRDAHGNFYVSDGPNNRVVEVDAKGKLVRAFGGQGNKQGELFRPYGIALDSRGRLYVVENVNSRVQVFSVE